MMQENISLGKFAAGVHFFASVVFLAANAWGQPAETASVLEEVQNSAPSFMVRVAVDKPSRTYLEGEILKLTATSERAGFLYAYYQQADGEKYQIFPNKAQQDNRIAARQPIQLPTAQDRFRWVVAPPFGVESIKVVVTAEQLSAVDKEELEANLFSPMDDEKLKGLRTELLAKSPTSWAEHSVQVITLPGLTPPEKKSNKRYGVFCGVSKHRYHYEFSAATEEKAGLDIPGCDRDATTLSELLKTTGGLEQVQVFTNEQATRQNFEKAVTQWLPSVSQPGDEVFIFFSGHTSQIPDDASDERDGQDELLVMHDIAPPIVFRYLIDQKNAGKLDQTGLERFEQLLKLSGIRPGEANQPSEQQMASNLLRRTGISDDLFGHWIQSLDGRKVVVILDTCYSGGYADIEKGFSAVNPREKLDFLDTELGRLKDIGQSDALILASSSVKKESQFRFDDFPDRRGPFGVMTSYLVEALIHPTDRISMQDAFERCQAGMKDYFQKFPPETRHKPFLIGSSGDNMMLKP